MDFRSDNVSGGAKEIVEALVRANDGTASAYGNDEWTRCLEPLFQEVFEVDCRVFPITTGTAANALALSALVPPHGFAFCHEHAHIHTSECGATEFYTGGAKLLPLSGELGKIEPEAVIHALRQRSSRDRNVPAAISLTQATEAGTVYRVDEIGALSDVARKHGMCVHMDGARFANAVVGLGCAPAEVTWKVGVDILTFGATKNGTILADAIVVFRQELAKQLPYRQLRGGHLCSKMRFVSAQLSAYMENGLWLKLAARANSLARRLASGLSQIPGISILFPVEGNEVFCRLPDQIRQGIEEQGFGIQLWHRIGDDVVRLVCAYDRTESEVDALLSAIHSLTLAVESDNSGGKVPRTER